MSNEELAQKVLELPLSDRIDLAQALWQSIEEGPEVDGSPEAREAVKQAKRRDKELASRKVEGRSHDQVMETARRAIECD